MFKFLSLEPETFGLDINDTSLKIIKLREKRGFLSPVSYNIREIAKGIIKDGIIQDQDALLKEILKTLDSVKGEKLKTKHVIASLPEEKSFSQVIQMPRMGEDDLQTAVPIEAENYIPLPADQMYLDFKKIRPIKEQLDHLDIFVIAVEKILVDSYVSVLKKSGLIPVALEVETQAIARALIKDKTSLNPVAILEFGGDSAQFIVFSGHSVRFTSSIPISSQQITEVISSELGISLKEAEHMKVKYGLSSSKPSHRAKAIFKTATPVLERLAQEIQKYLDFYSSHDFHEHFSDESGKKSKIEKIILSGGGSELKGMDYFMEKKLNLKVQVSDPWINFPKVFEKDGLSDLKDRGLSFTTALGLAMRGIDNNDK